MKSISPTALSYGGASSMKALLRAGGPMLISPSRGEDAGIPYGYAVPLEAIADRNITTVPLSIVDLRSQTTDQLLDDLGIVADAFVITSRRVPQFVIASPQWWALNQRRAA